MKISSKFVLKCLKFVIFYVGEKGLKVINDVEEGLFNVDFGLF